MKLIIFDIDGTLSNTHYVDGYCYNKAFEDCFKINPEDYNWEQMTNVTDWGIMDDVFIQEFDRVPKADEYERMKRTFVRMLDLELNKNPQHFEPVPGSVDFFNSLKNRYDVKLGVATGAWEASARLKLNAIGLVIDGVAFSNSDFHITREGITNDVIDQLEDEVGEEADSIIYFGDGLWDFRTCDNIGIDFIGIDANKNGKLKDAGAEIVFENYLKSQEILKAIESL